MQQIFGIGETVLDIIFKNNEVKTSKAGGSVLNAMVSLGRTAHGVTFITELGNDQVGDMIISFLQQNNIDVSHVQRYANGRSAIAMAFLNERNDASYSFYKDYPKERLLGLNPIFRPNDIVMFGSFYAMTTDLRPQLTHVLDNAVESNATLYYDPNYRASHLHELDVFKPTILDNFQKADIVRGSNEDFQLMFGVSSPNEAYQIVKPYCTTFIYTANSQGVYLFTPTFSAHFGVEPIQPLSTIGAGDNFNAGVVYSLQKMEVAKHNIPTLSEDIWRTIIANGIAFSKDVCLSYDNYVSVEFAKTK